MRNYPVENSEQSILNKAFDKTNNALVVESGESDGVGLVTPITDQLTSKTVVTSSYVYICVAAIGTAESSSLWQCKRIDKSVAGTYKTTWADGNNNFDNVATDPASLSYS